ncbi:Uncharacterised protein [Mycobacterium tuberculosis]|nr:Uncharacterised protein [Mycobacterium tuberculosis]
MRLSLRALERQRVGVGSGEVNQGMGLLGADGEISGAATDFQYAVIVGELGLLDQPLMDAVEPEQPGQQVVSGQKGVVSGGGHVVM